MSVISKQAHLLTVVVTIEVEPWNCAALLDLIVGEMTDFVRRQPGFVSANLHRNAEATRLVNYGQWESQALYDQARSRDEFKTLSRRVEALAKSLDVTACAVVFTEERPPHSAD